MYVSVCTQVTSKKYEKEFLYFDLRILEIFFLFYSLLATGVSMTNFWEKYDFNKLINIAWFWWNSWEVTWGHFEAGVVKIYGMIILTNLWDDYFNEPMGWLFWRTYGMIISTKLWDDYFKEPMEWLF